jgi:glycosyltransferase involved in cell wall biosynthesis
MASAPRILLILFEGLPGTVIESQVLVHAREMARLGIAEFEIWTFAWSDALYRRSIAAQPGAETLAGCPVRVFRGVRPAAPVSSLLNALLLAVGLLRFRPRFDILHARTDYAAAVGSLLRPWRRFLLVWDCRGDSPAEFADRFHPRSALLRLARAIRLHRLKRDRRRAARACDRAVFVSSVLETIAAPLLAGKPRRVIPCTASEALFHCDPALRDDVRRDLGFDAADRVYIFSGSLAPYQCFDETLTLFAAIRVRDDRARLLVVTPAQDEAHRRLARHPAVEDVTLRSATIAEMNGYLNAADAAFMLRAATATNRAAFPTKFAEYCLTGLAVVMTAAVPDAYATAQRLGNLLPVPADGDVAWPEAYDRGKVAAAARDSLTRDSVAPDYAAIYALTPSP